jgi:hypothetical protein
MGQIRLSHLSALAKDIIAGRSRVNRAWRRRPTFSSSATRCGSVPGVDFQPVQKAGAGPPWGNRSRTIEPRQHQQRLELTTSAEKDPCRRLQVSNRTVTAGISMMTSKKRAVETGSGFFKKAKSGRQDLNHVGGPSLRQLGRHSSSRDNTLLSCPQSDHDLRGDSGTEYQQSCSRLDKSDRLS